MAAAAEGQLAADQIHLPHAAEALVIQRADAVAVALEPAAPGAQRLGIMQPQDLDIGDPQPRPLGMRHDLGQGRRIAARENVFAQPRICRAGPVHAADRMQQRHPVRRQQLAQFAEKHRILVDADMLEHADRDDAVVVPALLAVVAQIKPHPVGQPGGGGAPIRDLELFLGQGQPGDVGAALAGQVQRQPAPARADIEHPLSRPEQQLRRDVALLVLLRGVDVVVRRAEIGAGILPVAIEKQLVELVRQIVMMRHVAPRPRHRVVLVHAGARDACPPPPSASAGSRPARRRSRSSTSMKS